MARIKNSLTISIVVLSLLLSGTLAFGAESEGTQFDLSGSLEAGVISQTANDDFFLNVPPGTIVIPTFGSNLSLRTDLQIIPNDQVKAKLRFSYRSNSIDGSPQNETFLLSRGFIDFSPGENISLRLGKQRLAWGTGYAWNPTNLLDVPRNAFTSMDDPEGIMAVRTDLDLGPVTGQLVLTPGNTWDTSGRALRIKASPGGVDLTLGLVEIGTEITATTLDFAGSLAGIGFHGEAAFNSEEDPRLNYLLGMDYNFPGGFIVAVEYYHNDSAFADAAAAQSDIFGKLMLDPEFDAVGYLTNLANNGGVTRDHYFVRCSKSIGENINTELMLVYNANDSSYAAQPTFEYTWKQITTLYLKGLLTQGAADSEVNLLPIANRWELGVKVSF